MLEYKFLWERFKYYMRILFSLILTVVSVFTIVPISYAGAITLQNAVEGELYTESSQPELYCLAMNTYFEAKSEPIAGQYATADVVLNRVNDARYPNTICEVVLQGPTRESWKTKQHKDLPEDQRKFNPVKHRCQFSWYCDGRDDEPRKNSRSWKKSVEIAQMMILSKDWMPDVIDGATFYHADYVSPRWSREKRMVVRIGSHLFYR